MYWCSTTWLNVQMSNRKDEGRKMKIDDTSGVGLYFTNYKQDNK